MSREELQVSRQEPRLLTVYDFAARARLSERTVRAMIADGRLPSVRPFGLRIVRVPESALLSLMGPR
jgi:excisionase family DNA binding protein